jgi:hypothetical protein
MYMLCLFLLTEVTYLPGKSTFAKPYHSAMGVPASISVWIIGLFLLLVLYVVLRIRSKLREEQKQQSKAKKR